MVFIVRNCQEKLKKKLKSSLDHVMTHTNGPYRHNIWETINGGSDLDSGMAFRDTSGAVVWIFQSKNNYLLLLLLHVKVYT